MVNGKMVNYYYKVDDLGDSFVKEIMQENQLHSVFKNFHLLQKSQEKNAPYKNILRIYRYIY